MTSRRIVAATLFLMAAAGPAAAQTQGSRFQVSLNPSSRLITTAGKDEAVQPRFKTYLPSASVRMALGRRFALEGDLIGSRGSWQTMNGLGRRRSPALVGASLNGLVTLVPGGRVQPYVTAGLGVMHLFKRAELGMQAAELLESANAGGGVAVMFDKWGVRADYRFVGMDSTAEAGSAFFGAGTRYAHRVSVGLMIGGGVR